MKSSIIVSLTSQTLAYKHYTISKFIITLSTEVCVKRTLYMMHLNLFFQYKIVVDIRICHDCSDMYGYLNALIAMKLKLDL